MGEDCDCGCRIMHDDEHPHSEDYSDIDDDTLETNKSTHENDKLTPSSKIDLEVMAERQQKLNSFLLPHNTELLEQQGPLLSDLQHKIQMAQPKRYCGNAWEWEVYIRSLRSTFHTPQYLFHDNTDKVQYAIDHNGSWAYHTNCDMQKTTMIGTITSGQDQQQSNTLCLHNFDCLLETYRRCMVIRTGDRMGLGNYITTSCRATTMPMTMYQHMPINYGRIGEMQSVMKCSSNWYCTICSRQDWRPTYYPNSSRVPKSMWSGTPLTNMLIMQLMLIPIAHQQNVKWFGCHNSTTRLFWTATPMLPEAPRSSQTSWLQTMCFSAALRGNFRCSSMLLKLRNRIPEYSTEYEVIFRML